MRSARRSSSSPRRASEAIEAQVKAVTDRLVDGLTARGFHIVSSRRPGEWSGIVAATHPARAPHEIAQALRERDVLVAHRSGRLRISPHFYNTLDEVDRLLSAL
jgi:selenocysteine lyase/cysteine desulfurase